MKILLVANIVLPKASKLVNQNATDFGGWLSTIVDGLAEQEGIEVGVISPTSIKSLTHGKIDGVDYYLVPKNKTFDVFENDIQEVFADFKPDILHIEGTEFKHANTITKMWKGPKVISLQGVINGHVQYYDGGFKTRKVLPFYSIDKQIANLSIFLKKTILKRRLIWEVETIASTENILGRTEWDRSYAMKFNPNANYYGCNRILRDSFRDAHWSINDIEKHTIYTGNSYQPLKGVHFLIEAVALLKDEYPDIKLRIAGISAYDDSIRKNMLKNGYSYYIRALIKKLQLEDNVEFTGQINQEKVVETLKKTHVYIMSSAIENSPNTLGEAMMLGVPTVASFVGGVSSMTSDEVESLVYRFDEVELLVEKIRRIFNSDELAIKLSKNARKRALVTHDKDTNIRALLKCYNDIVRVNHE